MRCSTLSVSVPKMICASGLVGGAPLSAATSLCIVVDLETLSGKQDTCLERTTRPSPYRRPSTLSVP